MNRTAKKLATRQSILKATKTLLLEKGFDQVTTRDIAKAAGVAIGTLFLHFKDKNELIKHLFFEDLAELTRQPTADRIAGALDWFSHLTLRLYHYYAEDPDLSKALIVSSLYDMDFYHDQFMAVVTILGAKLQQDYPQLSDDQSQTVAEACFGFYFFALARGLDRAPEDPTLWHQGLMVRCQQLLGCLAH